MSTCNQLDLQTLGSQLIMPKNLPQSLQLTMYYSPEEATRKSLLIPLSNLLLH